MTSPALLKYSDFSPGDTAVSLLKAGAETDKRDTDGSMAMELAPDAQVSYSAFLMCRVGGIDPF